MSRRARGDAGQMAGVEAVPFGLLVFTVGTLVVAQTWAVVDAKLLTGTSAREAAQAIAEAPSGAAGRAEAIALVERTTTAGGRPAGSLQVTEVDGSWGRCRPIVVEASLSVPAVGVPWRGERPAVTVSSRHGAVVDPFRDGLPGAAACPDP